MSESATIHVLPVGRDRHIQAFLGQLQPRLPDWDGSWRSLPVNDCHGLIQALVKDYWVDEGDSRDWGKAGERAQFIMTSLFHDRFPLPMAGQQTPTMSVSIAAEPEGFEVHLRRPAENLLPPIPNLSGGGATHMGGMYESIVGWSDAQLPPLVDLDQLPAEVVAQLVARVGEQMQLEDRVPFMFSAAFLVTWRGYLATQRVKGGAVYRDIHDPQAEEPRRGDVRINVMRTGPSAQEALSRAADGGVVVLG